MVLRGYSLDFIQLMQKLCVEAAYCSSVMGAGRFNECVSVLQKLLKVMFMLDMSNVWPPVLRVWKQFLETGFGTDLLAESETFSLSLINMVREGERECELDDVRVFQCHLKPSA